MVIARFLVLGDIGVVVDEADWHDGEPTRIDEEAEQLIDDALSFLSDLKSPESDPLHLYLNKDLVSANLLTREDEMEPGVSMKLIAHRSLAPFTTVGIPIR